MAVRQLIGPRGVGILPTASACLLLVFGGDRATPAAPSAPDTVAPPAPDTVVRVDLGTAIRNEPSASSAPGSTHRHRH